MMVWWSNRCTIFTGSSAPHTLTESCKNHVSINDLSKILIPFLLCIIDAYPFPTGELIFYPAAIRHGIYNLSGIKQIMWISWCKFPGKYLKKEVKGKKIDCISWCLNDENIEWLSFEICVCVSICKIYKVVCFLAPGLLHFLSGELNGFFPQIC